MLSTRRVRHLGGRAVRVTLHPERVDEDGQAARPCSCCGTDLLRHWHGSLMTGFWNGATRFPKAPGQPAPGPGAWGAWGAWGERRGVNRRGKGRAGPLERATCFDPRGCEASAGRA